MRAQRNCSLVFSIAIMTGAVIGTTACTSADQPAQVASGVDPANGNLAPADAADAAPAQAMPVSQNAAPGYNPAPAPPSYSSSSAANTQAAYPYDSQYGETSGDQGSNDQPIYASEAPPPIPEYSQPSCPGNNYEWTPGYWSYSSTSSNGYYWVPGVWVVAPYVGALWTPPYWEFYESRYRWHGGYWGTHIGFYGGIDYGFGYVGRGYYGGYWHGNSFAYNRAVTNVNVNIVSNVNVYNYHVANVTNSRVSYNGGPGGLNIRPNASEMAVVHEQRMAPVAAQVALARQSATNRAQFAAVNRGRPAEAAMERPLQTEYKAPAAQPAAVAGHPRVFAPAPRPEAARPGPAAQTEMRAQARPEPAQQQARPEPFRPAAAPAPQRAEPVQRGPVPQQRPEPARPQQARQEPIRPAQRMETARPAPQPEQRREAPRPQPAQRSEPARPSPAPRVEASRPAPAPHAEAPRPAPHAAPPHTAPPAHPEPAKPEKHP